MSFGIVAVLKFLSSRGLAFRGDYETFWSQNNDNYLGCLKLISEFDPFLADHIQNCGNGGGKGSTSYSWANICNEFTSLMGQQVFLLKDRRGESYDNALNMYSGGQSRRKGEYKFSGFLGCWVCYWSSIIL